jgi:hypothetical protein
MGLSLTLSLLAVGCVGRAIGEGAEKTLGPKGDYWQEVPASPSKHIKVFEGYSRFELGEVRNDFGKNVPTEFFPMFQAEFAKQFAAAKLSDRPGKTLVFRVRVIHYEQADTTDNILGPLEQVVAAVEIVDKDSGKLLASGNAIGRTGKSVGLGTEWKARGLAKALVKWVTDYYPPARGSN